MVPPKPSEMQQSLQLISPGLNKWLPPGLHSSCLLHTASMLTYTACVKHCLELQSRLLPKDFAIDSSCIDAGRAPSFSGPTQCWALIMEPGSKLLPRCSCVSSHFHLVWRVGVCFCSWLMSLQGYSERITPKVNVAGDLWQKHCQVEECSFLCSRSFLSIHLLGTELDHDPTCFIQGFLPTQKQHTHSANQEKSAFRVQLSTRINNTISYQSLESESTRWP